MSFGAIPAIVCLVAAGLPCAARHVHYTRPARAQAPVVSAAPAASKVSEPSPSNTDLSEKPSAPVEQRDTTERPVGLAEIAPFAAVGSSVVVLLLVLWVTWKIVRELRRIRTAVGFSSRGAVEMVGSADLEHGLRAYFVRVHGRTLVLAADTQRGGLAVSALPEEAEKDRD